MSTAASFSVNFPREMISSNSSPPLQILPSLKLYDLLCHNVVAFLVLEELVHLDNVGMVLHSKWLPLAYQATEDVDLIEEHLLLVLVHVALLEHFDRALGAGLSVLAHPDLSEGAYVGRIARAYRSRGACRCGSSL